MSNQTDRLNLALADRYRILRHLGEGGMASVSLCEDLKHDRKVALELLKPELAAVLGAERFVQEMSLPAESRVCAAVSRHEGSRATGVDSKRGLVWRALVAFRP